MAVCFYFILFLHLISLNNVLGTSDNPSLDMEYLFEEGVKHYLNNDWGRCVDNLKFAIEDWHWWTNNIIK